MQEFFNDLYNIENFTTYLIIAIGVLVVLFFLILFLGKRDKKIEETKRLEKLVKEKNAFKEESKEEKAEVKKENVDILIPPVVNNEETKEEVTDLVKTEENLPTVKEEVKKAVNDELTDEEKKLFEPKENIVLPKEKPEEVKHPEEKPEIKPIDLTSFSSAKEETVKAENVEETQNDLPVLEEIKLPDFNFEEIVGKIEEESTEESKPREVFSSVYVEPKEEVNDETKVDLPKLKEGKTEFTNVEPVTFDSISGESYDINK